jgi:SCY1-like protein 1
VVREQTVKAVLVIVPKLSDRTINGELLRHLAKTANDEQPGIRTNTTICLGKIARNLGAGSRTKVLTAAFGRALRDPFVHARNAALLALAATSDLYTDDDCATKILPGLCPSLVDKEKLVRDQASKTMDLYLTRIRRYAATLPDIVQPSAAAAGSGATPRMGTPANEGSSWAGWAISSFTNKLGAANGQIEAPSNGAPQVPSPEPRSSSVPPTTSVTKLSTAPPVSSSSGLKPLTSNAATSSPFAPPPADQGDDDDFDTSWGDTVEDDGADAWGSMEDAMADPFAAPLSSKPTTSNEPATLFDDKGEPDFSGWLSAQSQAKKTKPLPKGLAKTSAAASTRPTLGVKNASTGGVGIKKTLPAAKPKPTVVKKEEKTEEEDEGWGDAW